MFQRLLLEFEIFFSFSWRDWSVSIIPAFIIALGATHGLPLLTVINSYIFLLTWVTTFVYFHNLFSQIFSVAEDIINKPDRPIPSGKVFLKEAKIRLVIVLFVLLSTSFFETAVLPETLAWILTETFMSITAAGNHWLGKNTIALTSGTWSLLSASRRFIAPHTPKSQASVYAVSVWAGIVAHIQDLRDIKGDALTGRKTMPIAFGDSESRLIISFALIPASIYVLHLGHILERAPSALIVLHTILAYRVLQIRGSRYDHKTYMLLTYIFCTNVAIISTEEIDFTTLVHRLFRSISTA